MSLWSCVLCFSFFFYSLLAVHPILLCFTIYSAFYPLPSLYLSCQPGRLIPSPRVCCAVVCAFTLQSSHYQVSILLSLALSLLSTSTSNLNPTHMLCYAMLCRAVLWLYFRILISSLMQILPVTYSSLKQSDAGRALKALSKHADVGIRKQAKAVISQWKTGLLVGRTT